MQKKYPNDETVRYYLMRALQNEDPQENFDEILTLGEQLLESSNMEFRMGAIRGLCFTYLHNGNRAKALAYADMMPPPEDLHRHVLEGDALVEHCQNYFWHICGKMSFYMTTLLDCKASGYTHGEKHAMLHTMYEIFHMIFPNSDFGYWNDRLAKLCFFMARESAVLGAFEQSLEELEKMLKHVEDYEECSEISHSSLLVNRIEVDKNTIAKSSEETLGHTFVRYLNREEHIFVSIKNDFRYINIMDRLASL